MKTLIFILLSSCTPFVLGCHKKGRPQPQLPPETQTGAGTFGCKINGQIDTANYADNFGAYAVYQYIDNRGYFTQVVGLKKHKWYIFLKADSLKLNQNQYYNFHNYYKNGAVKAVCIFGGSTFFTDSLLEGELYISKLDSVNQIISGTFWFDAIDTVTGEKVEVRDGRFDLLFTR
jgi:hypothetical protein